MMVDLKIERSISGEVTSITIYVKNIKRGYTEKNAVKMKDEVNSLGFNWKLFYEEIEQSSTDSQINWNQLTNKKILISGASGMIGSYLVEIMHHRNKNYNAQVEVYALSRNKKKIKKRFNRIIEEGDRWIHFIEHDITVPLTQSDIKDIDFDYIIHAASNTHPIEYSKDPVGTITTNVLGAINLFELIRNGNYKTRMVLLSSVEIYGENRGDVQSFDEDYLGYINCNTFRAGYPESKRVSESLLQSYIEQYEMDGVIARLSRVYGPTIEADDSKAFSQFIKSASKGKEIVLKSEGNQLYTYTYIADACIGILKVMTEAKCGEAINISDNSGDAKLKDIAEELAIITNTKVVYDIPSYSEKKGYSTATIALLNSEKYKQMGGTVHYSLNEGMRQTLRIMGTASEK